MTTFVTTKPLLVGGEQIQNSVYDISSPYTTVNSQSCTGCSAGLSTTPTYDPTMSSTYVNIGGTETTLDLNTNIAGKQTVTGSWGSDDWSEAGYINPVNALQFFLIDSAPLVNVPGYSNVGVTGGAQQTFGLAPLPEGEQNQKSYLYMLKDANLIASMSTTVTLNVDAPTDIKFGGFVGDMHNRLGATASPTFDNVATADGGWVMNLSVTNYGTSIISSVAAKAKVYTNFQFISMPTAVWDAFIKAMPIDTDYWVPNNWDDATENGFVWQTTNATACAAAQNGEDMTLIIGGYNFTIPAMGGYVIDRINSATGLFPGKCTIMLTNDFYGSSDGYALGDTFFYAFQGLFE